MTDLGQCQSVDDAEVMASDSGQAARLRGEALALRRLADAAAVAEALDLLEVAVPQIHPRALPTLAERLARTCGLAMGRLRHEERRAVRDVLARARRLP